MAFSSRSHTYDKAVQQLRDEPPGLVIVTYHVDELRPYRLIQHIRTEGKGIDTPVILVRVLPFQLSRKDEHDIRSAYKSFGVDEFVDLYGDQQRLGIEPAVQRFRDLVSTSLADAGGRNPGEN